MQKNTTKAPLRRDYYATNPANVLLITGTFCEKDTDCKDACCVLEPTINSHLPICKPTLDEYHQCAAILYRKIWVGEKPDCGPCKAGLECVQKGLVKALTFCSFVI